MRVARIILGYLASVAIFALLIPAAVVAIGEVVDAACGLPRWSWLPVNALLAGLLGAFGLTWMLWSWWFLLSRGRGHPSEAFGIEVSPVTCELVTSGPYAHTRNPMVFGYFFVLLAIAVLRGSPGVLAGIAMLAPVGLVQIMFFEEPRLERRFGEAYRAYRRRVPRFLPLGRGKRS